MALLGDITRDKGDKMEMLDNIKEMVTQAVIIIGGEIIINLDILVLLYLTSLVVIALYMLKKDYKLTLLVSVLGVIAGVIL